LNKENDIIQSYHDVEKFVNTLKSICLINHSCQGLRKSDTPFEFDSSKVITTKKEAESEKLGVRENWNSLSKEQREEISKLFDLTFKEEAQSTLDFW